MNILVVIPTLGYGGAERLLVTLLPKLKEKGFNIQVCTLSTPLDLAPELEKEGITVNNIELSHRWSVLEAVIKLYKEAKKFQADVVWGHLYFGILYSRLLSIFFSKLKVVSHLHYHISSDSIKKGIWYKFRNWIFNKSQKLDFATIAVSKNIKQDYEKYFGWKRIEVIYNVIVFDKIDNSIIGLDTIKIKEKYGVKPNEFVIAIPGRLHESKGHKYFIEAVKILKENYGISIKAFIIGGGNIKTELENLIDELNLSNQCIFTGNVVQEVLFRIIKMSDIVTIPSLFEAFGIAAVEAMYLEKSVIVSEVDGLKEITTHNFDALQIPVKNSDAIAKAILKIINNKEFAKKLAQNAKKTAMKYDVNNIVNQWIDIFKSEKN